MCSPVTKRSITDAPFLEAYVYLSVWPILCVFIGLAYSMCIYRFGLFYVHLSVWPILCVYIGLAYSMCIYRFGLFYVYLSVWPILCVFIGLAYSTVNNAHIC